MLHVLRNAVENREVDKRGGDDGVEHGHCDSAEPPESTDGFGVDEHVEWVEAEKVLQEAKRCVLLSTPPINARVLRFESLYTNICETIAAPGNNSWSNVRVHFLQ